MTDTTVKYFHSDMVGAPVLSGSAGALVDVLDACLVNGWGSVTVDSVVVASNVATVTKSTGMTHDVGSVVLIAGATPSGLNGEQKVTATTANTVSFATTGITDQTATGTITLKLAPAGWAKTYSAANEGAYAPTDVTATGCLLRVDDTGTTASRAIGYESMSDIDTGSGPFPTTAQRSGGVWWSKSDSASGAARKWLLVADGKMFYFAREFNPSSYPHAYELHAFGDVLPSNTGDAFSCVLSGESSNVSSGGPTSSDNYWYSTGTSAAEMYMPRSYTALGSSVKMRKAMPCFLPVTTAWASGQLASSTPYPNQADGGLYVVPHYLSENSSFTFRGVSPGFYGCPQAVADGQFATQDSVVGVAGMSGKTLKALTCTSAPNGVAFFDITGPWR